MVKTKNCPLCHRQKYFTRYQLTKFGIYECNHCHLRRRSIKLTQNKRQNLYTKKYFTKDQKEYFAPCLNDLKKEDSRIKDFSNRLLELESLLKGKHKNLLDIGCATGTFIKLAQNRGWTVQGIDISSFAVKLAKQQKLPVQVASIENFPLPYHKFSAITAWEVLPNFENLNLSLNKIKSMLKPDGILAIQLTVVDSLLFDISHLIYQLSDGKLSYFIDNGYPINHCYHFSRSTLKSILSSHGFEVIQSSNVEFDFRYSKMPKIILPILSIIGLVAKLLNRTTQYRLFARQTNK
jgi:SAM-dependent methyltransferase